MQDSALAVRRSNCGRPHESRMLISTQLRFQPYFKILIDESLLATIVLGVVVFLVER